MRHLLPALLALSIATPLAAQTTPTPAITTDTPLNASMPAAAPADVASMDAIMAALYDVISGPPGKARDWNRMRSLFVPGAHMVPTRKTKEGDVRASACSTPAAPGPRPASSNPWRGHWGN